MPAATPSSSAPHPALSVDEQRRKIIEATMRRHQFQPDALIEVLHKTQELFGFLPVEWLTTISQRLHVPLSRVYGVATFYHFFSLTPLGHHTCTVCLGTACYVKGGANILAALEQATHLKAGHTTADLEFSLRTARCLGACGIAPVVVVDDQVGGHQTVDQVVARVLALLDQTTPAAHDSHPESRERPPHEPH
jgi:bidirectional [NiFe] hydrogenase diaphorase subunit